MTEIQLPRGIGKSHRSLEELRIDLAHLECMKRSWCPDSPQLDTLIATRKEQIAYLENLVPSETRGGGQ